jgi:hypothetical protein
VREETECVCTEAAGEGVMEEPLRESSPTERPVPFVWMALLPVAKSHRSLSSNSNGDLVPHLKPLHLHDADYRRVDRTEFSNRNRAVSKATYGHVKDGWPMVQRIHASLPVFLQGFDAAVIPAISTMNSKSISAPLVGTGN